MKTLFICLIGMAILIPTVSAMTLGEKKKLAYWQEQINENSAIQAVEADCGHSVDVILDESVVGPFIEENISASSYCVEVVNAMSRMCKADAISKEAVAGAVNKVTCTLSETDELGFTLLEGLLTLQMSPNVTNIADETREFLNSNL